MTDHVWFRLALRGIGVLLVGLSLPSVLGYLGWLVVAVPALVAGSSDYSSEQTPMLLFSFVGVATQAGFGLYLLLGGERLFRYCTRDLLALCTSCGYDLHGLHADRCPECGTPAPPHSARAEAQPPNTPPTP